MDLLTKLKGLTYLGWKGIFASVTYSMRRDWIELGAPPLPGRARTVDPVKVAEEIPGGVRLHCGDAQAEVLFLAPDLVRVTWTPGTMPLPYGLARTEWPEQDVPLVAEGRGWRLSTPDLGVTIDPDGSLAFAAPDGTPLKRHDPPARWGEGWWQRGPLPDGDRVFGSGLRSGPLDLRGRKVSMWNREAEGAYNEGHDPLYVTIPITFTLRPGGAAVVTFFENSFKGEMRFIDAAEARFEGGALRYYVIPGPPARALSRLSELIGRPAMPPKWALGFHQARWSYMNEAEVREVADGFAAADLPLSAIHLDIHHMVRHRIFTLDPEKFPDPLGMSRDLAARGIRLVAIEDPGVQAEESFDLYREARDNGLCVTRPGGKELRAPVWPGPCVFPDFTNPATRRWWSDLYPRMLDQGIAAFWHDMNEPSAFAAWGHCTLPINARHDLEGRGGDHLEAHNVFALLEARAGYEGMVRHRPDRRPWILTRSGWAGIQRYAWNWTGDNESDWWSLRQSVRIALSLSLAGMPYTGPDIGGFGGLPGAELFARWFQLGSFLPFFRVHSAFFTARREPYRWPQETRAILAEHLRLRYRLLPYWYTLARRASVDGHPLVRPLFWADPADPDLAGIEDAFLIGDDLLVAPAIEEGVRVRTVRLPAGRWHSWWDDRVFAGPGAAIVDAPLEHIPLLVREGAVLPMEEDGRIALHVFVPAQDGPVSGALFSDAGDGWEAGRDDRFTGRREGGTLVLDRATSGEYVLPFEVFQVVLHGASARGIQVDGQDRPGGERIDVPTGFRTLRLDLL